MSFIFASLFLEKKEVKREKVTISKTGVRTKGIVALFFLRKLPA